MIDENIVAVMMILFTLIVVYIDNKFKKYKTSKQSTYKHNLKNFKNTSNINVEKEINRIKYRLDDREFEIWCGELFNKLGYFTIVTPRCSDGGKDIILRSKDGVITYVECKHYKDDNKVGREIIQKACGSAWLDKVDNVIVITTSTFNKNAIECVKGRTDKVNLIDIDDIRDLLVEINKQKVA